MTDSIDAHARGRTTARLGLIGAECTGKSTLARELALGWDAVVVNEVVREFVVAHQRAPRVEEQAAILREQQASEDAAAMSARTGAVIIADPIPLMTAVYSVVYFDDSSLVSQGLDRAGDYDLIVWCRPDLPWIADPGMRDGPRMRELTDAVIAERFIAPLRERSEVIEATGPLATRLALVRQAWQPKAGPRPT